MQVHVVGEPALSGGADHRRRDVHAVEVCEGGGEVDGVAPQAAADVQGAVVAAQLAGPFEHPLDEAAPTFEELAGVGAAAQGRIDVELRVATGEVLPGR